MKSAVDAQYLLDYLHLRHSCDITERAGRGTFRSKFGWSRERFSAALLYGLDPSNGPLFSMTDAASAPLVPVAPPSERIRPILDAIAEWSVEMAKTSRKRYRLQTLEAAAAAAAEQFGDSRQ